MPQMPGLPESLIPSQGVEFKAPPLELIKPTMTLIESAMKSLPRDSKGQLVWIAQRVGDEKMINAALVNKVGDHVEVAAWIGKTWGTPESAGLMTGVAGRVRW